MDRIFDVVFNRVANYFKYVMCVFAFFSILGVLIPSTVGGLPVGNYFGMGSSLGVSGGPARAIFIILFSLAIIYIAVKKN